MPADDAIKPAVIAALIKDGWTITDDPLTITYEEVIVSIDLPGSVYSLPRRGRNGSRSRSRPSPGRLGYMTSETHSGSTTCTE